MVDGSAEPVVTDRLRTLVNGVLGSGIVVVSIVSVLLVTNDTTEELSICTFELPWGELNEVCNVSFSFRMDELAIITVELRFPESTGDGRVTLGRDIP